MSTRACYRFIDPDEPVEVITVYKHGDGYPEGAVCWITKALKFAWALPRFEADEFAAAFVAANKDSAKAKQRHYLDKATELEAKSIKGLTDEEAISVLDQRKAMRDMAEQWGPGGRYSDCIGGGVRLVNKPGLDAFKEYATDIAYLYDVTRRRNALHVTAYSACERDGSWKLMKIFGGTLDAMQEKYGTQYL
jgi:hypothetical protein